MLVGTFRWALRPHVHAPHPRGLFPTPTRFASHVPDTVLDGILLPVGRAAGRGFRWFRFLQRGSVHAYLLYVLAALVWLLVWRGGR
jgi:hydrogenase-4 component B